MSAEPIECDARVWLHGTSPTLRRGYRDLRKLGMDRTIVNFILAGACWARPELGTVNFGLTPVAGAVAVTPEPPK